MHLHPFHIALFSAFLCASSASAQVTIDAVTLDEAFAESHVFGGATLRDTLPALTLVRQVGLSTQTGTVHSALAFDLGSNGQTCSATLIADALHSRFGNATGSQGATHLDALIVLRSPAPTTGTLSMSGVSVASSGVGLGQGLAWVDVGNDGVDEFTLHPTGSGTQELWREVPLTVDASGTVLRLRHYGNVSATPGTSNDFSMELRVRFVPDASPASVYGPAQSMPILVDREANGAMRVTFPSSPLDQRFLLVGTQVLSVPLPFAPGDTLLTDVLGTIPMANQSVVLPSPHVPAGAALNLQGVALRQNGEVLLSGAVRIGG